jgi:hypothetical protein
MRKYAIKFKTENRYRLYVVFQGGSQALGNTTAKMGATLKNFNFWIIFPKTSLKLFLKTANIENKRLSMVRA